MDPWLWRRRFGFFLLLAFLAHRHLDLGFIDRGFAAGGAVLIGAGGGGHGAGGGLGKAKTRARWRWVPGAFAGFRGKERDLWPVANKSCSLHNSLFLNKLYKFNYSPFAPPLFSYNFFLSPQSPVSYFTTISTFIHSFSIHYNSFINHLFIIFYFLKKYINHFIYCFLFFKNHTVFINFYYGKNGVIGVIRHSIPYTSPRSKYPSVTGHGYGK